MGLPYATPVDMWSCGCIFAELFLRKPLFPGQYEMDQLQKIYDKIGTPSEEDWPENAAVARSNFKVTGAQSWKDLVPEMDEQAQDLVQKMLTFDPSERITASEALLHPYFSDYGFSPLSFSPASSSSRSMRSSDHSSSLNSSSNLSFSSHDESGGSLGESSAKRCWGETKTHLVIISIPFKCPVLVNSLQQKWQKWLLVPSNVHYELLLFVVIPRQWVSWSLIQPCLEPNPSHKSSTLSRFTFFSSLKNGLHFVSSLFFFASIKLIPPNVRFLKPFLKTTWFPRLPIDCPLFQQ